MNSIYNVLKVTTTASAIYAIEQIEVKEEQSLNQKAWLLEVLWCFFFIQTVDMVFVMVTSCCEHRFALPTL